MAERRRIGWRFAVGVVAAAAVLGAALWAWTPDLDRAALERRYTTPADTFVSVAGTILRVRDTGPRAAPAVLFVHGFAASLETWEPWAEALAAERRRVVRVDLPGSGLSPPDSTGDYTDRRSLQLLQALMDQLGLRQASLVGHSIGGRIAWRFAAEFPARVERLVLISPDGFASPGFEYGKAPHVPAVFALMRYALPEPLLRKNLEAAYADPVRLTDAVFSRYRDLLRAPGARGALLARMEQTVLVDPRPLLGRIRAPTLLLWGREDRLIPFAHSADYLRELRGARLAALDGTGHVPQEEASAASLAPVRTFLSERR